MLVQIELFDEIELVPKKQYVDGRGTFRRVYDSSDSKFLANQISFSGNLKKGTLRGMHRLDEIKQEFKLVECVSGSIFDVLVDCRPQSINYLNHVAFQISSQSEFAVLIPPGFAHGYLTLEDNSNLIYQMSVHYDSNLEIGLRWNDPALGISWPMDPNSISPKDSTWPLL